MDNTGVLHGASDTPQRERADLIPLCYTDDNLQ